MGKRILITGGAGFAGHHFVEHIMKTTDWQIVVLDKLTYASAGLDRLRGVDFYPHSRIEVLTADCSRPYPEGLAREIGLVDYILHMAAETHVDRSIREPAAFIEANILGTLYTLEFARKVRPIQFIYFGTDEVFGPNYSPIGFEEWHRYNSTNPYAATKAGAEELCLAYSNTHGVPLLITHCMNLFGERQHPEKFIPLAIRSVLEQKEILLHGCRREEKQNMAHLDKIHPGARSYIHCRNAAAAMVFLLNREQYRRDKINIAGEVEVDHVAMVEFIGEVLDKPVHYRLVEHMATRPGNDLRYGLDGTLLTRMGWRPPEAFWSSLEKTIHWTVANPRWLYGMEGCSA